MLSGSGRDELPLANINIKHWRWPEKPLISGRSGTLIMLVMKTAELNYGSTSSRTLLQRIKHFWFKLADMALLIIFIQLSSWLHHLANLYILKTWISLEQELLKILNHIFLLVETTWLCFKIDAIFVFLKLTKIPLISSNHTHPTPTGI